MRPRWRWRPCLCVCLSTSISLEPLHRSARNFVCGSSRDVARSSSGGVALRYVLPVLGMTSRLAVMGATPKGGGWHARRRWMTWWWPTVHVQCNAYRRHGQDRTVLSCPCRWCELNWRKVKTFCFSPQYIWDWTVLSSPAFRDRTKLQKN